MGDLRVLRASGIAAAEAGLAFIAGQAERKRVPRTTHLTTKPTYLTLTLKPVGQRIAPGALAAASRSEIVAALVREA